MRFSVEQSARALLSRSLFTSAFNVAVTLGRTDAQVRRVNGVYAIYPVWHDVPERSTFLGFGERPPVL
jgi:hypothetical protein